MSLADLLFGTHLIEILQNLFAPELNWVFETITLLGNDMALVGLSAVIYWCFDKPRGRLVTYVLLLGAYLNLFLKALIPWPRPPVDLRIAEKNEVSHGFPSGHAQDSTTFWTWVSLDFKKRILGALGAVVVFAVGISRVYLGLHYLAQVIGGWVIGFVVAGLGMLVLRHHPTWSTRIRTEPQALFAVVTLLPLAAAVLLGITSDVDLGRIGGYLFGFSIGAIAEDRYVDFTIDISNAARILRIAVGGALTGALALALGIILPEAYLVSGFLNSMALGLCVVFVAPALFRMIEGHQE